MVPALADRRISFPLLAALLFVSAAATGYVATDLIDGDNPADTAGGSGGTDFHCRFVQPGYTHAAERSPLFAPPVRNFSGRCDGHGVELPVYRVETNGMGFREDPFPARKPENEVRIGVLGDSQTFGWGVNRSDTYPEVLEQRLDGEFGPDIEVLNLGVPGYGMKDYYEVLRYRAIDYYLDLIVVTFEFRDSLDRERKLQNTRLAEQRLPEGYAPARRDELLWQIKQEIRREWRQNITDRIASGESRMLRYADRIVNLSRSRDIPVVFYSYRPYSEWPLPPLDRWAERRGVELRWTTGRFAEVPRSRYTIRLEDGHYNSRGNRWLAETLHGYIRDDVRRIVNATG